MQTFQLAAYDPEQDEDLDGEMAEGVQDAAWAFLSTSHATSSSAVASSGSSSAASTPAASNTGSLHADELSAADDESASSEKVLSGSEGAQADPDHLARIAALEEQVKALQHENSRWKSVNQRLVQLQERQK